MKLATVAIALSMATSAASAGVIAVYTNWKERYDLHISDEQMTCERGRGRVKLLDGKGWVEFGCWKPVQGGIMFYLDGPKPHKDTFVEDWRIKPTEYGRMAGEAAARAEIESRYGASNGKR